MLTGKQVPDASKLKVVTVMPCYDKKLEAVRPDFKLLGDGGEIKFGKEVDTVLATHELLELFQAKGIDFSNVEPYAEEDKMELS